MKTYQIKYQQTGIWQETNGGPYYYMYGLINKTEVVKTNNIIKEIAKIKKLAESFKSPGIFPNMKAEFVLKDVKKL